MQVSVYVGRTMLYTRRTTTKPSTLSVLKKYVGCTVSESFGPSADFKPLGPNCFGPGLVVFMGLNLSFGPILV